VDQSAEDLTLAQGVDLDSLIIVGDQHNGFIWSLSFARHVMYVHGIHNFSSQDVHYEVMAKAFRMSMFILLDLDEGTISIDFSADAHPSQIGS